VCVLIPTVYPFTGIFTQLSIILQTHTKLIPTRIKLKVIILDVFIFDITAKSYIHPHNYGNVASCSYVMLFPDAEITFISSIKSYHLAGTGTLSSILSSSHFGTALLQTAIVGSLQL